MHASKTFQYLNRNISQWRLNCKAVSGTGIVLQAYRTVARKGEVVFCMMASHLPMWILVLFMTQVGCCISMTLPAREQPSRIQAQNH